MAALVYLGNKDSANRVKYKAKAVFLLLLPRCRLSRHPALDAESTKHIRQLDIKKGASARLPCRGANIEGLLSPDCHQAFRVGKQWLFLFAILYGLEGDVIGCSILTNFIRQLHRCTRHVALAGCKEQIDIFCLFARICKCSIPSSG